MKTVVLTGGTGFVGACLARRLLDEGHAVHLLVRQGHSAWRVDSIRQDIVFHEVGLADRERLIRVVSEIHPDWVFHLAAYGAYASQTDGGKMVETNITGTMNLVEACLKPGFEAFVNTGSSSEYGYKDHAPGEGDLLEPNSCYAVTKASSSLYCRHVAQTRGVHLTTLRLYSVFGPYEEPTRLIPTLISRGLRGSLPPLVNPDTARDFVYTEDVNDAYLLAAGNPGQELGAIYNVATGVQTTLREVVSIARRALGIPEEPAWGTMPARPWDTPVWVGNSRKIRESLGWASRHSFEEGFRKTVDWFRRIPLERYSTP